MRRIGGTLGIALTWAIGWSTLGLVLGTSLAVMFRMRGAPLAAVSQIVVQLALRWAIFGALAGAGFAAVLRRMRGRYRSVDEVSAKRAATWGGAVGAAITVPIAILTSFLFVGTVVPLYAMVAFVGLGVALGAGTAAAAVAVAHHAPDAIAASHSGRLGAG